MKQPPSSEHYRNLSVEPIDFIEANNLNFFEGCIIKYVSRWRYKNGIDDLRKAQYYLDRLIKKVEQGKELSDLSDNKSLMQ